MSSFRVLAAVIALAGLMACSSDDDDSNDPAASADDSTVSIDGAVVIESAGGVDETVGALESAIMQNDNVSVVQRIDHQTNASNVGLELGPTQVLLFGNPAVGTPLMRANPVAGLDLPTRMLVWEDETGTVRLAHNSAAYLRARHALEGVDEALAMVDQGQGMLAAGATGEGTPSGGETEVSAGAGIETLISTRDFESTWQALNSALASREGPMLVTDLDHAQNAMNAGLSLAPSRLLVFGNPMAGTPLMQSARSVGLDLPQKMLVYEDESGQVSIAWNDPTYLAGRHGIDGEVDRLGMVAALLAELAAEAAGSTTP